MRDAMFLGVIQGTVRLVLVHREDVLDACRFENADGILGMLPVIFNDQDFHACVL